MALLSPTTRGVLYMAASGITFFLEWPWVLFKDSIACSPRDYWRALRYAVGIALQAWFCVALLMLDWRTAFEVVLGYVTYSGILLVLALWLTPQSKRPTS